MKNLLESIEKKVGDSYELPNRVIESVPNPKVTIRTAAYNHVRYIEKCIEGVLMQETDFPVEYIIGEDFSTDRTRGIVFEYAEKYPEIIRVITAERNVGLKANNYRCRKATRGEFTALCEGDDYWTDPKKLQKQIDLLTRHPECDLCFHPAKIKYLDEPDIEVITGRHSNKTCILPVKNLILNNGDYCPTASLVVRTKINKKLGEWYWDIPFGDYYYQILGADRGGALYLDEVMSVYNVGAKGTWSSLAKEHAEDYRKRYIDLLSMCYNLRKFDEVMNYRHHKWLRKRKIGRLFQSFLPFYSFNRKKRNDIKEIIRQNSDGTIKIYCYTILLFSFIYHRFKAKNLQSLEKK